MGGSYCSCCQGSEMLNINVDISVLVPKFKIPTWKSFQAEEVSGFRSKNS